MHALLTTIPDVDALLPLEPEELGAKMFFLLRAWEEGAFSPGNLDNDLSSANQQKQVYPPARMREVYLASSEAMTWLRGQGLIVPELGHNGQNG